MRAVEFDIPSHAGMVCFAITPITLICSVRLAALATVVCGVKVDASDVPTSAHAQRCLRRVMTVNVQRRLVCMYAVRTRGAALGRRHNVARHIDGATA